jgi:predicted phosphoadenosine phosphosulfate sulfurtransferase
MRKNNITDRKLGIMVMDNESNFTMSLDFMHSILEKNLDILDVHWLCIPLTLPCTVSSYAMDWQVWGEKDKENWVYPRSEKEYVINFDNHKFPFYRENMLDKEFYDSFGEWYSQGKSCASLIGIRTAESLNRYRAILNEEKETFQGNMWTKRNTEHTYNCYPIYDWRTEDIWTANAINEWDYNKLYDIFYKAGIPVHSMRVASPFMSESKGSLNLYRVIDPPIWAKLCGRVSGANFMVTYGKQLNYRNIKLPDGHTWKSFVKFLLDTLPKEVGENFKQRFIQSIKYWGRVGRGLPQKTIDELKEHGIKFKTNGYTSHGRKNLVRVIIKTPPDHLDMLSCKNSEVTSWKRFAVTILKNDHTCKYMGLAPTKEQAERQRAIQKKYYNV